MAICQYLHSMVSWKPRPFIFIHIPKCAGTSIEKTLLPIVAGYPDFEYMPDEDRQKYWLPGRSNRQHAKLRQIAEHFSLDGFFKFAIARNPWDRAVSQIEYLSRIRATSLFSKPTFKEKLRVYCQSKSTIWGHDLGACQWDYLTLAERDPAIEYIGRFESLDADFKKICGLIGIDPQPNLLHVFKSNRAKHYSVYYDEESAEWVRKRFARDIDYFGYQFEKAASISPLTE